jgi:nicotinamidase-related amidase
MPGAAFSLSMRRQALRHDEHGCACWDVVTTTRTINPKNVAIIVCDMWDSHWSRGAAMRVNVIAPRMDTVLRAARARGAQIIHAPSETMDAYVQSPARQRVVAAPLVEPSSSPHPVPALPIDDSDEGSDSGETRPFRAWSRQHPAIHIDQRVDGISDNGQEVYNFLRQRGSELVLIMGVHTNMCVLNRSFAIKQMVRWGVDTALVRDLTDTMYNPAMPPYVSHDEGTRLVVEYIEKFWCPTLMSTDLEGCIPRSTVAAAASNS